MGQLYPKAKAIWESKFDRAFVATQHVLEAFKQEFGREPGYAEQQQIEAVCRESQSYGCESCRRFGVWCACAC